MTNNNGWCFGEFTHSFDKYVCNIYRVPGTVCSARDRMVNNETNHGLYLLEANSLNANASIARLSHNVIQSAAREPI